jgi:5-formyltetrahydrofolate cyclo-ligase
MDPLAEEKAALRARMRAIRGAIPESERAALGERIESRLFDLPALRDARTVLMFYSFGSEVPTARMAERLARDGRRVLLPFLEGPEMHAAELRPGEPAVATPYGPKEPAHRVAVDPGDVDVVIAPGLAFDRSGYRVGYGGGHYDRYLARLGPRAVRVGIGFHAQLIEAVPHGPGDQRLDVVVTDEQTIDVPPLEPHPPPP